MPFWHYNTHIHVYTTNLLLWLECTFWWFHDELALPGIYILEVGKNSALYSSWKKIKCYAMHWSAMRSPALGTFGWMAATTLIRGGSLTPVPWTCSQSVAQLCHLAYYRISPNKRSLRVDRPPGEFRGSRGIFLGVFSYFWSFLAYFRLL